MASDINSMLSKGTMEVSPGKKKFFTYLLMTPKRIGRGTLLYMKLLNQFIIQTK